MRLRGERVDLRNIDQNLLVVTAGRGPHRARARARCRCSTCVGSEDVTHLDRPGGHIGLMAGLEGAQARSGPTSPEWLGERSDR